MAHTRTSNRDGNPWTNAATDPTAWHLTTPERRTELLNVLPPIDVPGGFAVSEPIRHDANGRAVYLCVAEAHGDPWVRELALSDMNNCTLGRPLGDAQADAAAKWLSLHADNNGDGPDPLSGHPPCPSWEAAAGSEHLRRSA